MAEKEVSIRVAAKAGDASGVSLLRSVHENLESIKHSVGSRSDLKEFFELLRGAGAVAGLAVAAETIKSIGEGAKSISEGLAVGDIKAEELPEKLAESLPVVGTLYDGLKDVGLAITGLAADAARAKIIDVTFASITKSVRETGDEIRSLDIELARAGRDFQQNLTPAESAGQSLRDKYEDRSRGREKKASDIYGDAEDPSSLLSQLTKARKVRDEAQSSLTEVQNSAQVLSGRGNSGQAESELNKAQSVVSALEAKVRAAKKDQNDGDTADETSTNQEIARIRQKGTRDELMAREAANAKLQALEAANQQSDLQSQGKFFTARLVAIQTAYDQEIEAAKQKKYAAQNGLDRTEPRFVQAEDDFERERRIAEGKRSTSSITAQLTEDREAAKSHQQFMREQADLQLNLDEQRLRDSGRSLEADRLQAQHSYADRLDDIKNYYQEQRQLHGEDTDELNKREAIANEAAKDQRDEALKQARNKSLNEAREALGRFARADDDRFDTGARDSQLQALRNAATQKPEGLTPEQGNQIIDLLQIISQTQIVVQQYN